MPEPLPELSSIITDPTPCMVGPTFALHFDPYILVTIKEPIVEKTNVQFYPIVIQTNHEGFTPYSVVNRRYSEFQRFRQLLVDKGLHPPPLRWTRKIPAFNASSRREEIQNFLENVVEEDSLSRCPKEIQSFLQSPGGFVPKTRRSSLLSTIIWPRNRPITPSWIPPTSLESKLHKLNQRLLLT